MKTVLVTGATGYIGSRLVKDLINRGFFVKATARTVSRRAEEELGTELLPLDVLHPSSHAHPDLSADFLIHCATANDIVSKIPAAGFQLSIEGTWNMLALAKSLAIPRIIFFSTFQVYGTELTGTVDESTPPRCQNAYGLNHWFGEEVCRLHSSQFGLDVAVVRPSNVYGAPSASTVHRETLVPTCFVHEAIETGELRLNSSGRQLRNFVSTQEVASACIHILDAFPRGFSIFNICSAYHATIIEIANMTAEIHRNRLGTHLPIRTTRDEPLHTDTFTADSALRTLWKPAHESRLSMYHAITALYEQSAHHRPTNLSR
jgi:UDP-glucose 4-epimerase